MRQQLFMKAISLCVFSPIDLLDVLKAKLPKQLLTKLACFSSTADVLHSHTSAMQIYCLFLHYLPVIYSQRWKKVIRSNVMPPLWHWSTSTQVFLSKYSLKLLYLPEAIEIMVPVPRSSDSLNFF